LFYLRLNDIILSIAQGIAKPQYLGKVSEKFVKNDISIVAFDAFIRT